MATGTMFTAAERNVRVPVIEPYLAPLPDPVRYGDVPTRAAKVQVVTFRYDMNHSADESFEGGGSFEHQHPSYEIRGRQHPWVERVNTAPPQHIAYGSLFTTERPSYGYS